MDKVKKYLLYLFLLENVAVQTSLAAGFANPVFYAFIAVGALLILKGDTWNKQSRQTFWPIFALAAVYVIYQFTFGIDYVNQRSLIYLAAKLSTFAIIITCIENNYKFYESRMLYGLALFMCFFILYGLATGGGVNSSSGRMTLGFTNENTVGTMGAFVLGTMLFLVKKWNWKYILIAGIGLYGILGGGSRGGVLVIAILVLMRYGLSPKILLVTSLLVLVSIYILPIIGLETVGVQRMIDTATGAESTNRDMEREACWMMIAEQPYNGWGFEAQNQGAALAISELDSHNGYMETLKFMGYPMGGLWIAILSFSILYALWFYRKNKIEFDMHIAVLVAFYAKAFYEGLYLGVHEFGTNLVFVCMAIVYYKIMLIKKNMYV